MISFVHFFSFFAYPPILFFLLGFSISLSLQTLLTIKFICTVVVAHSKPYFISDAPRNTLSSPIYNSKFNFLFRFKDICKADKIYVFLTYLIIVEVKT